MIHRLTIIGVGLIGGSLARAVRLAGICHEIIGCGRDESELKKAVDLGVIDTYYIQPAEAVQEADVVVVAVPLGAMEAVFRAIAPALSPQAVLTDVGSAKGSVVDAARNVFGNELPSGFVPGHPIAGTEKSGVEASFAELYRGRKVIITPLPSSAASAVAQVHAMWQACGAEVIDMTVEHHDHVLAGTSHLPHVLAYSLVDTLARMDEKREIFQYAAGGFRDFTRIASSDPLMWHDICLANQQETVALLERFQHDLALLTDAIRNRNSDYILETFRRAKDARDYFATLTRNC